MHVHKTPRATGQSRLDYARPTNNKLGVNSEDEDADDQDEAGDARMRWENQIQDMQTLFQVNR